MSDQPTAPIAPPTELGEAIANASRESAEKDKDAALVDYSKGSDDQAKSMNVKVHSPSRVYYDGPAFSISAQNATGEFDILPRHHRFMSLLSAGELVIRTPHEEDRRIAISGGLMHVKADRVVVFLDV